MAAALARKSHNSKGKNTASTSKAVATTTLVAEDDDRDDFGHEDHDAAGGPQLLAKLEVIN